MICVSGHYFEQNELLMYTLKGEITPADLGGDVLDTLNLDSETHCEREVVDCRQLSFSDDIYPEDLVAFSKKILTWRNCEVLLLIPADSPLHEGMAEALLLLLANKRKRVWLHYTLDEAVNLLHLIQENSPESAIRHLQKAI